jgi:ABC-type antimicrobial peptide transport system permease subunit
LQATNVWGQAEWSEIVGVVSDIKSLHPQPEAVPEIFVPYWQWPMQAPTILVRTSMDPSQMAATIRQETRAVISRLPPPVIRTMDDLVSETVAQPRLQAGLVSLFAVLALVLAAIGLYGVLSYLVTQRTREIGVRLALGAQRRNVLSLVIGNGMRLALAGVVAGVIAALILTRVLRSLLYEVQPTDPWTLAGVSLLLILITFMACWLPARRASRVNPMEALRYE